MKDYYLKVEKLSYSIEKKNILKEISFVANKGELIGIIGPNGSGKTTLLKSINGIYQINGGDIVIEEKKRSEYEEKELARRISFMNQNINISFDFSCLDIVMMGRYPYLEKFQDYTEKDFLIAKKYMEQTKTKEFEEKSILTLSGGEMQRVIFAKVLTQESDIMLLDEPSSNLDMMHEEELFQSLKSEKKKLVIAVVHNLRIAMKYCSRLILLSEGEIVKDGIPEEVITEELLRQVYGVEAKIYRNPVNGFLDFCLL